MLRSEPELLTSSTVEAIDPGEAIEKIKGTWGTLFSLLTVRNFACLHKSYKDEKENN